MSKYTTTIKNLIDNGFDFQLTEYPIFDEAYRDVLNKQILDYYYMYEIGFETAGLFRHYLKNKMSLIMPKYNALLASQDKLLENIYGNVDLTETSKRKTDTNGSSESNSTNSGKTLFQDTPQGQISNTEIDAQTWATNLTQDKATVDDNTATEGHSVDDFIRHITGNNGKKYNIDIYNKLVDSYLNINQEIINELNDLFMGVF